ncbi:hypothetical protein TPHA_0A02130 [Tetrapisispora phaffii CBS 4417]|uniref:Uncharacterized protein n=1 Tax=Tetrapisispora phaffii (strain ATCC 24235 / CBS 4417 / NBRC 1672 / NRRL Y-8282 / UCD 70-5) TaxID=1071381 RepID=G8BN17_TETPH|nr:hypothetical protein TPHA_0A02130 [Tetrapisispora phaffii CBS 4417]CCE61295.1 hypothetical protein TPHA_0A02130 [Tetrapisispora phaffii CBS 4417]
MAKQRIINCVGQLPFNIQLNGYNDEWNIKPLLTNPALYTSFQYLNDNENYEQHIVGWTGEITRDDVPIFAKHEEDEQINEDETELKDLDSKVINADILDQHLKNDLNNLEKSSSSAVNNDDPLYLSNQQLDSLNSALKSYLYSDPSAPEKKNEEGNTFNVNVDNVHPVWLLRRDQKRWRMYAENIIWPTFHYILKQNAEGEKEKDWWYDYVKFNEAYAMEISKIYKNGDVIWIHDYYLLLLPQLLRMQLNDRDDNIKIAYFHHTSWPSNEYFRCLPRRKQILDGLVGADRVTFQNDGFARHFVSSCKRLLDCTHKKIFNNTFDLDQYNLSVYGGDIIVDSLPIGIDSKSFLKNAFNKNVDAKVLAIKQAYQGKKIIIGRDRLNETTGVIQKLRAFETFLAMNPEWIGKVCLIQVSSPIANRYNSSIIKLEQQINDIVNSINAQYGELNFTPVQHYYMRIPNDVYLSLLRAADLCLVTTVRDGINTTSLEYVTLKSHESQFHCYGDPLIISEFSGSSTVLKDAMIVNPWDSVAVAKKIKKAFSLTKEEKYALQKTVWSQVPIIQNWTDKLLDSFKEITDKNESTDPAERKITPALNRPVLLDDYNKAQRRLFLFDYDGTLTPIVQDPAAAIPTARLYSILNKLVADPKNEIWIISGRDSKFLNKWLGSKVPELGLSAEHGCFIKNANTKNWINLAEAYDMTWQKLVAEKMQEFTDRTPGSFIETKKVALTWHYRKAVPELGEFSAKELKNELLKFSDVHDLEVMDGKANIEVRPKFVNKGEIVKRLIWNKHGETPDFLKGADTGKPFEQMADFVLCLGDDRTDEDMFKQLNSVHDIWSEKYPDMKNGNGSYGLYPVSVGSGKKKTVAKAHLTDPQQVLETLGLLIGNVNLFESAGTVNLDTRGHVKDSERSKKSKQASVAYALRRSASNTNIKK